METLVAVGLSVLVLALLFTALEAMRRQLARRQADYRADVFSPAEGLRTLVRDLACATHPRDGIPPMVLDRNDGSWHLRWTATELLPEFEQAVGLIPIWLRYADGAVYRAEGHDIGEDDPPWITGLEGLEVQFHDGLGWHETWPPDGRGASLPIAVRLTVRPRGEEPAPLYVSIPAGRPHEDASSTSRSAR